MELDFGIFWNSLTLLGKIYWAVAIPSTLIFLISFVLALIGKDADATDVDLDVDIGFSDFFINFKAIMSFFTMFAWIGIAGINTSLSSSVIIIVSIIAGIGMMLLMATLMYYMDKLQYSGTLDFNNAIGATGYVYLTIPPNRQYGGKVQVTIQGSLRTLDAMTEETEAIKTNTNIEVIEVLSDNVLLVIAKR